MDGFLENQGGARLSQWVEWYFVCVSLKILENNNNKKKPRGAKIFFSVTPEFNAHLAENRHQFGTVSSVRSVTQLTPMTANNSQQTGRCFSRGFFKCRFSAAGAPPSKTREGRNLTDEYFLNFSSSPEHKKKTKKRCPQSSGSSLGDDIELLPPCVPFQAFDDIYL